MDNNEERNINITLKNNDNENDESIIFSVSSIFSKLKKFFIIWVAATVLIALLSFLYAVASHTANKVPLTALVSFTYPGIESGLDPAGNKFDVNSIKSPAVIEDALNKLGRSLEELEAIRRNIRFQEIIPENAVDRIAAYKSIFESNSSAAITAAQEILDTSYYPTQYKVFFDYAETSYSGSDASLIFNTVLDCYRDYFFDKYGYNKAMGNSIASIDYETYDYAEAIDVFTTSLETLRTYVRELSSSDTTRFRSNTTGYTFADLTEAISTIEDIDIEMLSSYITVNNVTKNKETLTSYYEYRIESLERSKNVYEEQIESLNNSIEQYQKDTITILGNDEEGVDTTSTQGSKEYDDMFSQKFNIQSNLSKAKQQISYYKKRVNSLNDKPIGNSSQIEKVEADMAVLNEKVSKLIDDVNATSNEYYSTVTFANAYNILVPSSFSSENILKNIIDIWKIPLIVSEIVVLILYILCSFTIAIVSDNRKSPKNHNEKKK